MGTVLGRFLSASQEQAQNVCDFLHQHAPLKRPAALLQQHGDATMSWCTSSFRIKADEPVATGASVCDWLWAGPPPHTSATALHPTVLVAATCDQPVSVWWDCGRRICISRVTDQIFWSNITVQSLKSSVHHWSINNQSIVGCCWPDDPQPCSCCYV